MKPRRTKLLVKLMLLDDDLVHDNVLIMRATLSTLGFSMKDLHDLSLHDLCDLYEIAQEEAYK